MFLSQALSADRSCRRAYEKTIKEIEELLEKQALALSELAESNRNLALAVRTNRIIAGVSLLVAIGALVFAIVW